MKKTSIIGVCLLAITGILASAKGEPFRTDINPALLYYQAFVLTPSLSKADSDYLGTNTWIDQKLPERFGTILTNYNDELKLLRQAGKQKVACDWGIDMSRGIETLLPHLAAAKRAALEAQLQAMWDLQNGNETEACDDLIAILALGRNVSKDKTLISALVEFAIEGIVNTTVARNFNHFSPPALRELANGFDSVPSQGTVADTLAAEKPLYRDWLLHKIQELRDGHPGDQIAVMEGLHQWVQDSMDSNTNYWNGLTNAAGGTVEGIIKMANNSEPLYEQVAKILALPHGEYEEQMKKFGTKVEKSGDYLFYHSFPGLQASRRKEFRTLTDSAMVRAAIEYKLRGEEGLKSVMDPCGNGPFTFQRFIFDGVDRGFELKSVFNNGLGQETYIFVEKDGPTFYVTGTRVGQAVSH